MKTLKAILVDDEYDSREILENYIRKYCPNVELLALCKDIQEGEAAIKEYKPDLVFLDIEMPFGNGFDLLEKFDSINFEVIFVTAFSNYAIKALNMSAAYYLLKPIDIDELVEAVQKVTCKLEDTPGLFLPNVVLKNLHALNCQDQKLVIPNVNGFDLISVAEIVRCEAMDNYTQIYMDSGKKHLVSKTLKHFENLLTECNFLRVHKSHLVNLKKVVKYIKGKTAQLILEDQSEVDISVTRKAEFLEKFN